MANVELIPESIKILKMSDEEYFSSEYKDFISNSKLSLLNPDEGGSIEKFLEGFKGEYSDSFALGSAVHGTILQPESYTISEITKPNGKLGIFVENVFKYRQLGKKLEESMILSSNDSDYYSGKFSDTRRKTAIKSGLKFYLDRLKVKENNVLFLSESLYPKYQSCISALGAKNITNALKPTSLFLDPQVFNEYAIFAQVKVTLDNGGIVFIGVKGKLDNFIIDHDTSTLILNDLKTTSKPVKFFMGNNVKTINDSGEEEWNWYQGSFEKFHYYRQMGMYSWLMQCAIQKEYGLVYKTKANMIVVEAIPNFQAKIFPVTNGAIKRGLKEMKELLIIFAEWMNKK